MNAKSVISDNIYSNIIKKAFYQKGELTYER